MRRRDLLTVGRCALTLAPPRPRGAQDKYPSRTVRLIVPTPAGGVYDLMGRLFVDRVGPSLGTAIVENRAGGNAMVGVTAAAQSAPDGYTLLLGSNSTHIFQPAMMRNAALRSGQAVRADLDAVGILGAASRSRPKLGINTLAELIDYAKSNPGKLTLRHARHRRRLAHDRRAAQAARPRLLAAIHPLQRDGAGGARPDDRRPDDDHAAASPAR